MPQNRNRKASRAEPSAPRNNPAAGESSGVGDASRELLLEISKTLLSGTLASTRGAMQLLQGLSGFLLASYTTVLVGFGKELHVERLRPTWLALPFA